jgi:hypothetical protein
MFLKLRQFEYQSNSIILKDLRFEILHDTIIWPQIMELGKVIVFEIFLYMRKDLSELFSKKLNAY